MNRVIGHFGITVVLILGYSIFQTSYMELNLIGDFTYSYYRYFALIKSNYDVWNTNFNWTIYEPALNVLLYFLSLFPITSEYEFATTIIFIHHVALLVIFYKLLSQLGYRNHMLVALMCSLSCSSGVVLQLMRQTFAIESLLLILLITKKPIHILWAGLFHKYAFFAVGILISTRKWIYIFLVVTFLILLSMVMDDIMAFMYGEKMTNYWITAFDAKMQKFNDFIIYVTVSIFFISCVTMIRNKQNNMLIGILFKLALIAATTALVFRSVPLIPFRILMPIVSIFPSLYIVALISTFKTYTTLHGLGILLFFLLIMIYRLFL